MNDIGIYVPKEYVVDFEKVKTLDDVISILSKLKISVFGEENIKGIEHLVKEL